MRRIVVIGIAAAMCAALVPAGALAGKTLKSEITVENSGYGQYSGKVTSSKQRCREGRTVEVWHDTNGNGQIDGQPPDYRIGQRKTDDEGVWEITGDQAPLGDNIIARVLKKKLRRKNCGPAEARTESAYAPVL